MLMSLLFCVFEKSHDSNENYNVTINVPIALIATYAKNIMQKMSKKENRIVSNVRQMHFYYCIQPITSSCLLRLIQVVSCIKPTKPILQI